jgi:hypothetical protein
MGRLRHAYLEMVPSLDPYFTTARHDDMLAVLSTYGATSERPRHAANALHGLTTMPGMIAVIDAALAGALAAIVMGLLGAAETLAIAAGVIVGILVLAGTAALAGRLFVSGERVTDVRFPRPSVGDQSSRRNT